MPKSQIGSMTSSGQMDVSSNSDEPTQINYRTVDIIGIGVLELHSQFEITPGLTYDDLSVQICQLVSNQTLVALVSTFGPYPVFRYPLDSEAISPSARRIYVVDKKEDASLVIVRTHDEDVVVPISLSAEDYQSSMELAITRVILAHGYSPISVKDCLGISDIGNQNVATTRLLSEPAHPTIAFVETESRSLEFRSRFKENVLVHKQLRFLFSRGEALVRKASRTKSHPLQLIHLTRSLLHLIVSAQEIVWNNGNIQRLDYYLDLHRLADGLETCMEAQNSSEQSLEHHFNDLCGDYFGAVAVRQSHGIFSRLMSALPVLHGPSATLMQRHDALNPNSKLKHTAAHESTSMSGKVQDMSRPEHRLLHSDKTIEEFFKLSLKDSDTNSAEQSDKLTFGRRRLRGSPGERKGQGRDEEPRGFVLETLPPEWATLQATRPNVHQDTATTALSMEERSTTRAQLSTPGPSTTDSPQSPSHDHLGNVTALHTIVPSPSAASTDTVPLVNEDSSGTRLRHPIPDTLEISQAELVWLNGNPTIVQWKAGGASTFKVIYSCKICRWPELAFETILKHVLDIHYLAPTQSQVGCSCGVLFADTQTLEQHRNHDHYADQELKIIDKSGLRGLITNKAQMIEKLEPPLENLLMYHSGNSNAAKARMLNWIALQRSDSFPGLLCRRSRNQTRNRRLLRLNRSLIMVCCPCGAPRFDMRQMAIHLLETHIREPGFCCKLCSSAFNAKANLIRHVLRFHPNSPNEQIGGEPEKDDEESVMDMDDLEADPDHEKQIRLEEQYIERVFEAFNCPD